MSAVMRHFQTGCDVGLPREFAEVLRDRGSKNSPPHRNLDSYSFYVNDDGPDRDYESLLSSGLGYPHSYDSAIYSDTVSFPY